MTSPATIPVIPIEPSGMPRARAMVQRAQWASRAFATYDIDTVRRAAQAAAAAAAERAAEFAQRAVEETGFGVVEDKIHKNIGCSTGIWETYRSHDYVTPIVDPDSKILRIPRPAGVILALTPSTNPVATASFKVLLALLTRNAIIVSPHPYAKSVTADAVRAMAQAAIEAGAPDGCIQVVDEPSIPIIDTLMTDDRVDLIVATGGSPMVRAAYRSGNPAYGVGPGNVPVLVDETADLTAAAERIVTSKAFDHSILCTNESVLIVVDAVAERFEGHLRRAGAYLCDPDETTAVRSLIFTGDHLDTQWIGKSASDIAAAAGVSVPRGTRILVTPIDRVVPEEMLTHEKLMPVLALVTVPTAARGIDAARAVLRVTGAGHSAAIHSENPDTILAYAAAVPVLRVTVNVGNSLGGSGFETGLAPTMTIGTGFPGRSSLGANLAPAHLVHVTQAAWNLAPSVPMPTLDTDHAWPSPQGPQPPYPLASNLPGAPSVVGPGAPPPASPGAGAGIGDLVGDDLRDQVRRLVLDELRSIVKG